ncbi:methyltransferase domain-containing protein [Solibacillus sp. MA9]|uniref:Methyltransferase domain-containing protein n=1 Tax=Solibacillus palustris TaxID=2908203 RepID=A0ABS9UHA8_9BACL|nr:class I SAM-dependent methyltransferase [Solibacillus sp. MA9]MCH7323348.1 methyltransferase domain-containing protein [Solibacillus sp. MA9]
MNQWDEKFKSDTYFYGTKPNAFLEQHVNAFEQSKRIACYAEGEGRNAVFLATKGHDVTAFDYAQEGLQKTIALAKSQQVQVKTELKDLIKDSIEEDFYDGAVMIFGHFSKADQYEVLDKIVGSLKADGIFLMEVYEDAQLQYQTGGPKQIDFLYNESALHNWANKHDVLHFMCAEVERIEGIGHNGRSKVLQLILKKRI